VSISTAPQLVAKIEVTSVVETQRRRYYRPFWRRISGRLKAFSADCRAFELGAALRHLEKALGKPARAR